MKAPPSRRAYFAASLPLVWSDGAYRATLPTLPDQNLVFSFMSREGIIGGMLRPRPYYWIAAALLMTLALLVGRGLGWLAALLRVRRRAVVVAVLTALLIGGMINLVLMVLIFNLFPWLTIIGYATTPFIGVVQWLFSVVVTLVAAVRAVSRYHRQRSSPLDSHRAG